VCEWPYRQSHGTHAEAASSTDPSDRNLFPLVSEPPADDESALAAASVLDESSERPAELSDVWWRRLNEVTHPVCLHNTVVISIVSVSSELGLSNNNRKGLLTPRKVIGNGTASCPSPIFGWSLYHAKNRLIQLECAGY